MALRLRPPTHRADAGGVYVPASDPAWDKATYAADLESLLAAALTEKQDAAEAAHRAEHPEATAEEIAALRGACKLDASEEHKAYALHPVVRYMTGKTRYQIGAEDWAPDGSPCTVRDRYIRPGFKPCEFTIRRLRSEVYQQADEIVSTGARLTQFARASLRAISAPEWTWTSEPTAACAPPEVIEALHEADPSLLLEIGRAVINLCRPLDHEVETPR